MRIVLIIIFLIINNKISFSKPYYEFTEKELKGKKISLFGSFKCYDEFIKAMDYFESKGAKILCPIRSKIVDINADFRLFKDDDIKNKTEKELQQVVFDKTREYADIVYVVNSNNCLIGLGTSGEIDYVIAINDLRNKNIFFKLLFKIFGIKEKKVYCAEKPQSSHIKLFCEY